MLAENAAPNRNVAVLATENDRTLNIAGGMSGTGCVSVRRTTKTPKTTAATNRESTKESVHECSSAREIPQTNEATDNVTKIDAPISGLGASVRGVSLTYLAANSTTAKQIGTLIQNAERHPKVETKKAPNVGPDATPNAPTAPFHATAWLRRSRENTDSSKPNDAGVMMAPPTPCTARPAISTPIEGATAQTIEPVKKSTEPNWKSLLRPILSARRPDTTRSEPKRIE